MAKRDPRGKSRNTRRAGRRTKSGSKKVVPTNTSSVTPRGRESTPQTSLMTQGSRSECSLSQSSSAEGPPPKRDRNKHAWWLIPVTLGAIVRLLHQVQLPDEIALSEFALLDSAVYADWADQIARGDIWGGPAPYTSAPLYAYLLGFLRSLGLSSNRAIFAFQAILGLGSIYTIAVAAARLSTRRAATLVACLYAVYAPPLVLETKLLGESVAVLLTLMGVNRLTLNRSWRDRTLAGTFLGASALARPELILALPCLAAWTWWQSGTPHRKRMGSVLSFALPAAVLIGTVTVRNYVKSDELVLVSSQGGVTFYQGNNSRAEGSYSEPPEFSGSKATQASEARAVAESALDHPLTSKEVSAYWYGRGFDFLIEDTAHAVGLVLRKFRYWTNSAEPAGDFGVTADRCLAPTLYLAPVPFGLFLAASILGFRRLSAPTLRRQSILHGILIVTGLLTALIFFASTRYRIVPTAHLAVCSSVYLEVLLASFGRGGSAKPTVWLTVLTLLTLPRWTNATKMQAAAQLRNWATVHYAAHRWPEALSLLETAKRARPDNWTIRYSIGLTYGALGDFESAATEMRRALRLRPHSTETLQQLRRYENQRDSSRSVHVTPRCEL